MNGNPEEAAAADSADRDSLIKTLTDARDLLNKHGIYLLPEATGIRGYDVALLFVDDPSLDKGQNPFLKILRGVLEEQKGCKAWKEALGQHRELAGWLGISEREALKRGPKDWLKIGVDQFPCRLVVVYPPTVSLPWTSGANGWSFLRKRICWVTNEEVNKALKNCVSKEERYDYLALWLKAKWVQHIVKELRGLSNVKSTCLLIDLDAGESNAGSALTVPVTVPAGLQGKVSIGRQVRRHFTVSFDEGDGLTWDSEAEAKAGEGWLLCSLCRHATTYIVENDVIRNSDIIPNEVINDASIGISGTSSGFGSAEQAVANPEKAWNYVFDTLAALLLRVGIVDERVQEWYAGLSAGQARVDVQASRATPAYLDDPRRYQQYPITEGAITIKVAKRPIQPQGKNVEALSVRPSEEPSLDAVVLHVGILDKKIMGTQESGATPSVLIVKEVLTLKDLFPFVVLTSGRGYPENLPPHGKYLPYSGIERCMSPQGIEKLLFMRGLLAV